MLILKNKNLNLLLKIKKFVFFYKKSNFVVSTNKLNFIKTTLFCNQKYLKKFIYNFNIISCLLFSIKNKKIFNIKSFIYKSLCFFMLKRKIYKLKLLFSFFKKKQYIFYKIIYKKYPKLLFVFIRFCVIIALSFFGLKLHYFIRNFIKKKKKIKRYRRSYVRRMYAKLDKKTFFTKYEKYLLKRFFIFKTKKRNIFKPFLSNVSLSNFKKHRFNLQKKVRVSNLKSMRFLVTRFSKFLRFNNVNNKYKF